MTKAKETTSKSKMRRALTPEARENQLIAMAYDRAEEQLRDGTASSQVITHFLKLGTEKERLEKEKLMEENRLLKAKTEALAAAANADEKYEKAVAAMKKYSGNGDVEDYADYY